MIDAKIQFSENELNLATDIAFILTKNRIIEKVYTLFGLLADKYIQIAAGTIPLDVLSQPPKISRGENYNQLPYVMLDYPRLFSKEDVFAIRTMFWWGNDMSITLHLKGKYKEQYQNKLHLLTKNTAQPWYIQRSGDEWLHHKEPPTHENMNNLNSTMIEKYSDESPFIKIACFTPLTEWNNAAGIFENKFTTIVKMLRGIN